MPARPLARAALILPDYVDLDAPIYVPFAAASLTALDMQPGGRARVAESGDRVAGETLVIHIRCETDSAFGPQVVLSVQTASPDRPAHPDHAARVLKAMISRALADCTADLIAWQSEEVLLDRAEFAALHLPGPDRPRRPVRPGPPVRPRPVSRPEHVPLTQLLDPAAGPDMAERRLRAASWLMTGMVATVSLPVGAALYVHGAARGTDLRRVSQSIALCGLFALLESKGLLAGMTLGATF